ncbi:hypothetical protein AI2957V1_3729 [Klebsiella pneumoniae]|nr:hypothetical protein AI2960V1_3766 [Klebsiella pneumoniae]CAF2976708.1 hypothetical protein AI2961V1_3793 [Klebsiella pneumoniae]CAF2993864.1 hypothetical protein AI2962V1_3731 [Klebsiella pneumoniae]CAF3015535.1 hypothetical protein AI2965V1_3728 [Klebsiella pneumoniae]CAF3033280.1 hypothetical protein AI2966V1_3730 [Klebsiella pneumoniae]
MTDITELALLVSKAKASVFTLEYISQFEPADIDSDDVDLRFEVDGRDTGTNVSIVDECGQAAKVIGTLVEALEKAQQHENEWKSLCEAAAVDLDDWREIDDKSRDLLCKLADTVIAKAEQSAEWERKAISNFEDCAEMSSRLEELESQRLLAFAASNRWADKFREAEKRITELESRTVKLPAAVSVADWMVGIDVYEADLVLALLAAAGIKVEAE